MEFNGVDSPASVSFSDDIYDWTPIKRYPSEVPQPPLKKQRMEYKEEPMEIYDEETNQLINQLVKTVDSTPGSFSAALKSSSHGWLVPLSAELFVNNSDEDTECAANLSATLDEVLAMPATLPGPSIPLPEWGEPRDRIRNRHLDVISRPIDAVVIDTLAPDCVSSRLLAQHIVSDLEKRPPNERKIVAEEMMAVLQKDRTVSKKETKVNNT